MRSHFIGQLLTVSLLLLNTFVFADPPVPEKGFRWVLQEDFSDEFNGNSLDKTKWRDSFDGWKGRSPAKFDPTSVSVQGGTMQIKNKKLDQADGDYTIGGGAVQSLSDQAFYGYYECSFKASKINMSTTFWMSNRKVDVNEITKKSNGIDCDKDRFSQELDICESVGGTGNFSSKFRTQQNFNTHYRYIDCNSSPEKFYSAGNNAIEGNGQQADASIVGESWEDFHTYACYWRNANVVDFYTDGRYAGTINVSTDVVDSPFPRPMKINMVTETYNWAKPYPTDAELANDNINTSFYDWIRAYKLVPINEDLGANAAGFVDIYNENVDFVDFSATQEAAMSYAFPLTYQANNDREIYIILKDQNGNIVKESKYTALTGYGRNAYSLDLDALPVNGLYTVTAEIRPTGGDAQSVINSTTKSLTITGGETPTTSVGFVNAPSAVFTSTELTFEVNYTVDATRDLVVVLTSPNGTWLGSKTQTIQAGTATIPMTITLVNAPEKDQDYKVSAIIREQGGDWTTNILAKDILVDILKPSTCQSELVSNGCFEDNSLDSWIQWGAGTRSVTFNKNVFDGNYALKVEGIGAAEQIVHGLKENTTYQFKANVKIEGSQFVSLGVKEFGETQELSEQITNNTYEEISIEFTTGENNTSAKIFFYSPKAEGIGYADNFTIEELIITNSKESTIKKLTLYPNPTTGIIHLSQEKPFEVYSVTGQLKIKSSGTEINLTEAEKGLYLIKIENQLFKVVKD